MLIYLIRLLWLAAVICALASGTDVGLRRYRGWFAYLCATCCVGVFALVDFVTGPDAWLDHFWPLLLVVLILRGVSMLEALHYQTCRLPDWSRMMLGIFLMGSAIVMALAVWRHTEPLSVLSDDSLRDQFVRFRRYAQLWIGVVASLTTNLYLTVRRDKHGPADRHALVVALMSLNYAAVGLVDMSFERSAAFVGWEQSLSYGIDAALLFWWALKVCPHVAGSTSLSPDTWPRTPQPVAQDAESSAVPGPHCPRGPVAHGSGTGT